MIQEARDHGGGVDAAAAKYGGVRSDWLDLSTGINPVPYPVGDISPNVWAALPDRGAQQALVTAARRFWNVPDGAAVLAAPGASSLIARIPALAPKGRVDIPTPTYNEHAAAFAAADWDLTPTRATDATDATARVIVHPNNPTGHLYNTEPDGPALHVIDESFCDVSPDQTLINRAAQPGVIVLKSFGKFWGLAGVRLGFAIGDPDLIARLEQMLGPWPVAGPALEIGHAALTDHGWADTTRQRLDRDSARLDDLMTNAGATLHGGTSLFRLYEVEDAAAWQHRFAKAQIWTRIFPYSDRLIRLGLPAPDQWHRLEALL